MAVEDLPNGFYVPQRDEIRDQYQKDVKLRIPGAPIGEGSQAHAEGSVIADTLIPIYADGLSVARDANLDDKTLEGLKAEARGMGLPELLPASGGTGFVQIAASAGGVGIDEGRELYDEATSLRFECAVTQTYFDKGSVPIRGIDVGPTTNLGAGTVLRWRNPPAGLGAKATVLPDADGEGLTGGRNEETPDELRDRIRAERASPAAGGNDANVRRLVKEAGKKLGIPIQECFVYPCIRGPGTTGFAFTLRPAKPGGSRTPNAVQIAAVLAYVVGALPGDDGILACTILEEAVTCSLEVEWDPEADGWADLDPWPSAAGDWYVSLATSATSFKVKAAGAGTRSPQVGQSLAFYNTSTGKFVRKRIGAVSGPVGGEYTITVDASNGASDTVYAPALNERFCPWSDSLDMLVTPMATEFDKLGPGEQVEEFFDEGYRQRRFPRNAPGTWPSVMRHKMLDAIDDFPQIADVQWVSPSIPHATPVGTPGVSSNLLTFARLLVFPG